VAIATARIEECFRGQLELSSLAGGAISLGCGSYIIIKAAPRSGKRDREHANVHWAKRSVLEVEKTKN